MAALKAASATQCPVAVSRTKLRPTLVSLLEIRPNFVVLTQDSPPAGRETARKATAWTHLAIRTCTIFVAR